jgi:hypothetical protein
LNPNTDISPAIIAPYFQTQDEVQGIVLFRHVTRHVRFYAEDYETFSSYFQTMSDEIKTWRDKYGRQAKTLALSINAHPWILKRILKQLYNEFPEGHGYGDFCRVGTVTLHLYDPLDSVGQHYQIRIKGKLPVQNSQ